MNDDSQKTDFVSEKKMRERFATFAEKDLQKEKTEIIQKEIDKTELVSKEETLKKFEELVETKNLQQPPLQKSISSIIGQIAHYDLIRILGKGNMGKVFLAYDRRRKCSVALKIMSENTINDTSFEKRFLREAQSMSRLSHPNIIKIYDIGKERHHIYFTMEFIEGQSLAEITEQQKLSSTRIAEIVCHVAKAVHYAHQQNILHRDLKPANIMITTNGKPVVMDFGLARQIRDDGNLSKTGEIVGTPAYMAPEQIQGRSHLDARTDVYSLGVCLYRLLTGQTPFTGSKWQILIKITKDSVIPPSQINHLIPEPLEQICLKAMEKKKDLRFSSALELAQELENFLSGSAISIRREVLKKVSFWLKKYQFVIMVTMILALIGICGILYQENVFLHRRSQIPQIHIYSPSAMQTREVYYVPQKQGYLKIKGAKSFFTHAVSNGINLPTIQNSKINYKIPLNYGSNNIQLWTLGKNNLWNTRSWSIIRPQPTVRSCFLGNPQRNPKISQTKLENLQLKWKFKTKGQIGSSPIVVDGIVYFGSDDWIIYAFDIKKRQLLWKYKASGKVVAAPAVHDGFVYFTSTDQTLYAFDMYSGHLKWNFSFGGSSWSSPTVFKNIIYFGNDSGTIYAVDSDTGKQVWKFQTKGAVASSPAVKNDAVYATSYDKHLYVLKRKTGKVIMKVKTEGKIESSPVIHQDSIYFGCQDDHFYTIKKLKHIWKYKVGGNIDSTPVIKNDIAYFGCNDKHIYALNTKTNKLKWRLKVRGIIFSTGLIVGQNLYIGDYSGYFYTIDIDSGKLKAEYKTHDRISSTATFADGQIFITSWDYHLYVLH